MMPVIPCSASSIPFISVTTCTTRRNRGFHKYEFLGKVSRVNLTSKRVVFLPLKSVGLLPRFGAGYLKHNISRLHRPTAAGTDLEVEQESPTLDDSSTGSPKEAPFPVEGGEHSSTASDSDAASSRSIRSRPIRRSQMPAVKNEDLIPGAMFTGKVVAIQPFGAFVDIGAFTDGLVHISRMSDGFVKNIGDVVTLGQEVKVRIVEVNAKTGRISFSMRENDDKPKPQPRKDSDTSSQKAKPAAGSASRSNRRNESGMKMSKLVEGQDLVGTVINIARSGAFVLLPDGEEGFLPMSEELEEDMDLMSSGSSLEVGQEINVSVLRVARGQVTLTMRKEDDSEDLEEDEIEDDDDHVTATNAFVLAFRRNEVISSFLNERAKLEEAAPVASRPETLDVVEEMEAIPETEIEAPELLGQLTASSDDIVGVPIVVDSIDSTLLPVEIDAKNVLANDDNVPSIPLITNEDSLAQISSSEIAAGHDVMMETPSEDTVAKEEGREISKELYDPPSTMQAEEQLGTLVPQQNGSVVVGSQETSEVSSTGSVAQDHLENVGNTDPSGAAASSEAAVSSPKLMVEVTKEDQNKEQEDQVPMLAADTRETPSPMPADNISDRTPDNAGVTTGQTVVESSYERSDQLENVGNIDASGDAAPSEAILSSQILVVEETAKQNKSEIEEDLEQIQAVDTSETSLLTPADDKSDEAADNAGGIVITNGETVIQSHNESTDQLENVENTDLSGDAASTEPIFSSQKLIVEETPEQIKSEKQEDQVQIQAADSDQLENVRNIEPSMDPALSEAIFPAQKLIVKETVEQIKREKPEDQVPTQAADTNEDSPTPADDKSNGTPEKAGVIVSTVEQTVVQSSNESSAISPILVKQLREETGAGMMDCKKALSETVGDIVKAQEYLRKKGLASAEKKASRTTAEGRIGSYIHDSRIGVLIEVNCETDFVSRGEIFNELVDDLAMQVAACPQVNYLVTEDVSKEIVVKEKDIEMQKEDLLSKPEQIREKIVDGRIRKRLAELALLEQPFIKNDKMLVKDWVKQTIATVGENIKVKRFVRYNLGEGLEKKSQDFAAEVAAQTVVKESSSLEKVPIASAEVPKPEEKPSSVTVSASLVKQLREETGAGMMDCKKALAETGGNIEKAQEYLRKKGLSAADKKSSRLAAEGRIGSYIHDSRIGVLVEVNSETDFVARGENFKALVDDLAMQIVACPQVKFVSIEDIPEDIVRKEEEIEMQREDILSKPENLRERIVAGRVSKRLGELALLEQPFIKDDGLLVKDLVKQTVAALGENIRVRRFVRFTLGEEPEDVKAEAEV